MGDIRRCLNKYLKELSKTDETPIKINKEEYEALLEEKKIAWKENQGKEPRYYRPNNFIVDGDEMPDINAFIASKIEKKNHEKYNGRSSFGKSDFSCHFYN